MGSGISGVMGTEHVRVHPPDPTGTLYLIHNRGDCVSDSHLRYGQKERKNRERVRVGSEIRRVGFRERDRETKGV